MEFTPPGPVGAAFMGSHSLVNAIMGPVGSAKTSCLMMKTIQNAARQPRSKIDGVRYTRALFVRETFRQLYGTTIPSWWNWMPKKYGEWKGGGNEPAYHHIRFQLPDKSIVDLAVLFEALGDQNVEALFKGKEFNLLNLNEGDTLSPEVLSQGVIRILQGRYPGEKHVDPCDCVIEVNVDFNAPDIENYLYKLLEEDRPEGYAFFKQPGGLDAKAENRLRATREAYEAMEKSLISQGRDDLARRNIHNLYGFTRDGKPVYPEYRDDFHCAGSEILPVRELVIKVDFDQGLRPAATLRQRMPNGQTRILDELYCETGAEGLCEMLRQLMGTRKYEGCRFTGGQIDPAAAARDPKDMESYVDTINRLMGWTGVQQVRLAQTNNPARRQGAVRLLLRQNVGDGQPGILISSTCRIARRGFNSEYRFKKRKGSQSVYEESVDKVFPIADVQDTIQYGALDDGGYEEVVGRADRNNRNRVTGNRQAKVGVDLW